MNEQTLSLLRKQLKTVRRIVVSAENQIQNCATKKEASTDKDEQNNLSEPDLIDNSTIDEKSHENNDDKNREIEVENQTEKIEETVANESEKSEKSQNDADYPDSSEVNLLDENSVTEEIPLTEKVEEPQESEDTSKTTASASMRLYKRKSRRQHK